MGRGTDRHAGAGGPESVARANGKSLTLFNPLTYAAEGMRYAMVPPLYGQPLPTLALGWVLLALCASFILALWGGLKLFHRRVVS